MLALTVLSRDAEMRAARAAGWSRWELVWERWQEAAHAAQDAGDGRRAARLRQRAHWLGRLLARGDPRRVTGLANAAWADRMAGRETRARRRYRTALAEWHAGAEGWVAGLEPAPRARSSLFHLRMEARHRETYLANLRRRMAAFAAETEAALAALAEGEAPAQRFHARWRGEKPPVHDDTRRFLGAALLLALP